MSRSRYLVTRLVVADLVAAERSTRYQKGKISDRSTAHKHGATLCRELYAAGDTLDSLANLFGCTPQAIYACVTYRTYRNV